MTKQKEATDFTKKINQSFKKESGLDWDSKKDQEFAERGFIAKSDPEIKDEEGKVVWSNKEYEEFQKGDAPDSVNPSLWRVEKLNNNRGLFEVTEGIYQVRGQSLSNITFIEGETGYIVIDPNISKECAKNNLELLFKHKGKKSVVAVIYSHSHIDHWGGIKGVASEEEVKSGKTKIIASKGFLEYAITENLIAGNAMSRRSQYMYGYLILKNKKGQQGSALGKTTENGKVTLIPPTDIIDRAGKKMIIDGVEMEFQFASGEAPTGLHVYFPKHKTLHIADNCYASLHNVYTIRGAFTRDAIDWRNTLNNALKFKDMEVMMGGHNWPIFGGEEIKKYLKKQRDALKYLHDQTLRLINLGYKDVEIANMIELPPSLAKEWYLRGYYGSIKHDVRGIYSKYMGWYNANPATLDPLPPRETGKMVVEYMGGADSVIEKAKKEFDKGEYRWVAQIMNFLVWAEPENKDAKSIEADALEQLGYQTENATWRNAYLTAAQELREGVSIKEAMSTTSADVVRSMPMEKFFDFLGVQLNGPKAFGKQVVINWEFTDLKKKYILSLENAVLNYEEGEDNNPDLSLTLTRETLNNVILGEADMTELVMLGKVKINGDTSKLEELFSLFDKFKPNFPITTHEEIK